MTKEEYDLYVAQMNATQDASYSAEAMRNSTDEGRWLEAMKYAQERAVAEMMARGEANPKPMKQANARVIEPLALPPSE